MVTTRSRSHMSGDTDSATTSQHTSVGGRPEPEVASRRRTPGSKTPGRTTRRTRLSEPLEPIEELGDLEEGGAAGGGRAAGDQAAAAAAAAPSTSGRARRSRASSAARDDGNDEAAAPANDLQQQLAKCLLVPRTASGGGRAAAAAAAAANDDGSDDDFDLDDDAALDRLAASIRSALESRAGGGGAPKAAAAPITTAVAAATAASAAAAPDSAAAARLRWRPDTQLAPIAPTSAALGDALAAAAAAAAPGKERGLARRFMAPPRDAAALAKAERGARPDTAGPKWYGLPATPITDDVKRDLRLLRLRGAYDAKRFYKGFDETKFPKYFQFGTVQDDALDRPGERLARGERRERLADQLLADAAVSGSSKRRYARLQEEAQRWKKAKKRKTEQPRNKGSRHRPKH